MNQLSKQEIDKLFTFVKSKYVRHIDVQYEVVDHLATQIEELKVKDENLSFEKALNKVYKRYPITGFTKLLENKSKSMNRYWQRVIWIYLKDYFKLPKIILTALLVYMFYNIFAIAGKWMIYAFFGAAFVFSMVKLFQFRKESQKYLVIQSFSSIYFINYSLFLAILNINFSSEGHINNFALYFLAFLAAITLILTPAYYDYFPNKLKNDLERKYSHLNLKIV